MQTTEAETSSAPEAKRKPGRPAEEIAQAVSNFPPSGLDATSRMGRRISEKAKHLNCDVCGGSQWVMAGDKEQAEILPALTDTTLRRVYTLVAYVCTECCFVRLFSVRWLEKLEETADQQARNFAAAANRRNS